MTASTTARTVTRADLYEQVWSTPMRTLARDYGITDVGLAKICRRMGIPRPGPGYWARIQHGQKSARIPLPALKAGIPESATISPSPDRLASLDSPPAPRPVPPIVPIPQDLASPHTAVRALRKALRDQRPYQGILSLVGKNQTPIRVSPAAQERALRLLDGFLRALEARGHTVSFKQQPGQYAEYSLEAVVGGANVEITLKERLAQSEHVPAKGESRTFAPTYDYAPSGELTLRVGGTYGDAHRSWADRARKRLEERLGEAVLGIEQVAQLQAEEERARVEWRRQYEQERRNREVAKIREEHERELARDLCEMAAAWRESRELRVFLEAVEDGIPAEIKSTEGFRAWLAWAHDYAQRRDPLRQPKTIAKVLEPEFLQKVLGPPLDPLLGE
jgi:hypothetical protein